MNRSHFVGQLLTGVLLLSNAAIAVAQGSAKRDGSDDQVPAAPPAVPKGLVLPKPISSTDVAYPAGASGDAEVVLTLVITKDGEVRRAEVAEGAEPFATAARTAAILWRFKPATRDGKPIVAKVRFAVTFVEEKTVKPAPNPKAVPPPDPYGDRSPNDGPPSAVEEPPKIPGAIDVTVEGERVLPPSVSSLKRAEVRLLPGAFGDPFRAIEVLPGVTPIVSGLPFFYLRGAPPGNIGYFLDGIPVPYLFHAAAGPSVVHPAIVESVDLYAGGFPSRYGRFSGGIVSAEVTEPRTDWHGEAVLRLVDVGALVEGGFADGKGSALVGGRYSYTAGLFSLISPEITLDYRDFQTRIRYAISDTEEISLFAFGSYDFLSQTTVVPGFDDGIETVLFGSEFYRVDARYDARLPNRGKIRAAITAGYDQSRLFGARNGQTLLGRSRVRWSQPLDEQFTVRAGFDLQVNSYMADSILYTDPDDPFTKAFNDLFPPRLETGAAYWADVTWRPSKAFEVTPGLRVDTYYSDGAAALAVDPRLTVVVTPTEDVRVLHSLGVANQPPAFAVPIPGLAVASLRGGLQRSFQASSGVELKLPGKITASATGYINVNVNMTDSIGTPPEDGDIVPRSLGGSKGIELYVRRSLTERLGGFISYTFSRTTRSLGDERFLARFDRPHVFHSALGYRLGKGWQAGIRFSVYSGAPLQLTGNPDEEASRDPAFYRLDFRLEKKWRLFDTAWISFVMEMVNASLNTETLGGNPVGPVSIPSIGLEGGF